MPPPPKLRNAGRQVRPPEIDREVKPEQVLEDFWAEVDRLLKEKGVPYRRIALTLQLPTPGRPGTEAA